MNRKIACLAVPALMVIAQLSVAGCVAAGIGGTTYAVKASQRGGLEEAAIAGDPVAQYELGQSHCCMGPGFSTQTATEWLCKSAVQGYAPAQYELGRIYAGEISRTPAPGQKVLRAVTAKSDPVLSQAWFRLAADQGYDRAMDRLSSLEANAGPSGRPTNPGELPCVYSDVFGNE